MLITSNDTGAATARNRNPADRSRSAEIIGEAAIIATLTPGAYTAILRGAGNTTGLGLVELYDLQPGAGEFANVSVRAEVSPAKEF